jgi:hypothetical protein
MVTKLTPERHTLGSHPHTKLIFRRNMLLLSLQSLRMWLLRLLEAPSKTKKVA